MHYILERNHPLLSSLRARALIAAEGQRVSISTNIHTHTCMHVYIYAYMHTYYALIVPCAPK